MIEILLHGMKMNPLVSLHYYAPVCALINLAVLPFTEGLAPFYEIMRVGYVTACVSSRNDEAVPSDPARRRPLILLSNALVAFLLNIAAVFLVSAGSDLALTFAGVFKDILLVTCSVIIFSAQITPLQIISVSCCSGEVSEAQAKID